MTRVLPRHQATASRRRRGRSRNSLAIQLSAFALTFILIALLVVTSSRAAFVAQNDNVGNVVTAATVDLTDDDNGTAMFNSPALAPGTNLVQCIDVTYSGNVVPLEVKLYAAGAPTGALAPYLNLTVDVARPMGSGFGDCTVFGTGTGGVTNVYNGTVGNFSTAYTGYANGRSTTWVPAGTGDVRTFRFTVSVQSVPAAEAQTTTFGFSWETQTL